MLTEQTLRRMLPAAGARPDAHLPYIVPAMIAGSINTPDRITAFLAQLAHESGDIDGWRKSAGRLRRNLVTKVAPGQHLSRRRPQVRRGRSDSGYRTGQRHHERRLPGHRCGGRSQETDAAAVRHGLGGVVLDDRQQ